MDLEWLERLAKAHDLGYISGGSPPSVELDGGLILTFDADGSLTVGFEYENKFSQHPDVKRYKDDQPIALDEAEHLMRTWKRVLASRHCSSSKPNAISDI